MSTGPMSLQLAVTVDLVLEAPFLSDADKVSVRLLPATSARTPLFPLARALAACLEGNRRREREGKSSGTRERFPLARRAAATRQLVKRYSPSPVSCCLSTRRCRRTIQNYANLPPNRAPATDKD